MPNTLPALLLEPEYREYVWGGRRLRPDQERTAEAWVIYAGDRIAGGPLTGLTLAEAARLHGADLLGTRPFARTGTLFPLLIKLLDCADWLSLQVHPDDQLALKLEGEGQYGKTEAWHFIAAEAGAQILCGLRPGVTRAEMERAIRAGGLLEAMQRLDVRAGESIFIPAGMIHALGPGLLLYEVQQTSDWTYRVYDWDRPATPQRPLHIEKSVAAANPDLQSQLVPAPALAAGERTRLVQCDYFTLETFAAGPGGVDLLADGSSFHTLTVVEGSARLSGAGWELDLERFQSALVPANAGAYRVTAAETARLLRAWV
jgi:mannose-6-phosphate isomerase